VTVPEGVTEAPWLGGRLVLRQPARGRGHRAGSDAALLAAAADPRPGERVVDLGAGTGAVGLALAARVPDLAVVLVEREPDLAELAAWNAAANGLSGVSVVRADVLASSRLRRAAGLVPGIADLVATNPPYLDPARTRASPVAARASAHTAEAGGLSAWLAAAAWLLRPGGRLALVHRADALATCLAAATDRTFGAVAVRPVHPRAEAPASRILLTAVRGSRAPGQILPPLVLHGEDGAFLPRAAALHEGAALTD
jgi:tRNA1(Val) A37 N6-methylase TrmN6